MRVRSDEQFKKLNPLISIIEGGMVIEARAEQFTRPGYTISVTVSGIWTDVTFLRSSESKASAIVFDVRHC